MEKTDIVLCNSSFDRQKMFYFWRPTLIMHPTTTEGEIMKSLHICLTDSILLMPYTFRCSMFQGIDRDRPIQNSSNPPDRDAHYVNACLPSWQRVGRGRGSGGRGGPPAHG